MSKLQMNDLLRSRRVVSRLKRPLVVWQLHDRAAAPAEPVLQPRDARVVQGRLRELPVQPGKAPTLGTRTDN
jgi:hypothetical protein